MRDSLMAICALLRALLLALGLATALAAQSAPVDAEWAAVRGLAKGNKVELHLYYAPPIRGQVVQVAGESITISAKNAVRTFAAGEVKRVKVPSAGRRVLHGAIGIGVGVVLGFVACPTCRGEGAEDVANRNVGIGAGVGSLAFLIPGYRTIYKGPKQPTSSPTFQKPRQLGAR